MVLDNTMTGVMSHIVVGTDAIVSPFTGVKGELPELTIE